MVGWIAGGHDMEGLEERDEQSSTNLPAVSQTNAADAAVDEDEEVKALSRKEKNRIAAQKSRMKKIERIKELEKELEEQCKENENLYGELIKMKDIIEKLSCVLWRHTLSLGVEERTSLLPLIHSANFTVSQVSLSHMSSMAKRRRLSFVRSRATPVEFQRRSPGSASCSPAGVETNEDEPCCSYNTPPKQPRLGEDRLSVRRPNSEPIEPNPFPGVINRSRRTQSCEVDAEDFEIYFPGDTLGHFSPETMASSSNSTLHPHHQLSMSLPGPGTLLPTTSTTIHPRSHYPPATTQSSPQDFKYNYNHSP
ncbi:hypothetical protein WR25_27044 [Diploscapter pachys]|uniref:BZIP domain-containing protein n=1 Tax=Diploscapter pachys TaxID=2018661 RepID=A0A2A2KCS6_9BILA|nr:hypothetical protein WR25_27044 [Diploscapter pachys]